MILHLEHPVLSSGMLSSIRWASSSDILVQYTWKGAKNLHCNQPFTSSILMHFNKISRWFWCKWPMSLWETLHQSLWVVLVILPQFDVYASPEVAPRVRHKVLSKSFLWAFSPLLCVSWVSVCLVHTFKHLQLGQFINL